MTGRADPRCSSPSTPRATTSGTPAARRHQTLREHLRARPAARVLRAARRPADLRDHLSGRARPRSARGAAIAARARRLRDRRASSRLGDAAVRAGGRRAASVRVVAAAAISSTRSWPALTGAIDDAVGAAAGVVSIRALRLLGLARLVARARRLPGGLERRAAVLRERTRGDRISSARRSRPTSWRTTTRRGRARAACSSCRSRPRSTAASRRGSSACTAAPRRRTRRARLLRLAPDRPRALAAAVVQLGRRHDRARPRAGPPRRADAQSAVSFERGHRRRQSVQPDAKSELTRSSTGSAALLTYATQDLRAEPLTFAEFRAVRAAPRPRVA